MVWFKFATLYVNEVGILKLCLPTFKITFRKVNILLRKLCNRIFYHMYVVFYLQQYSRTFSRKFFLFSRSHKRRKMNMVFALLFIQLYRRYITFSRRNFALLRKHTATVNAIFLLLQNTVKPCILDLFSKVKTSYQLWTYYARSFRIKWLCNFRFHYSSSSRVNCILTREEKTSKK